MATSPFGNEEDEKLFASSTKNPFGDSDSPFSSSRVKDDSIISSWDFFKMNLGAGLENFNELYDSYMPDFLVDAGRALYESGAEGLEDYYPEYPEGLYSSQDKLGWILERTAEGSATNAGLLLASGVSNALMSIPSIPTKVAGAGGRVGTFGLNWLLQFNENVATHTENAGKELQDFNESERAKLFAASSINALLDQIPRNFALKGLFTGKRFNRDSIKEIYERFNSAEKQQFVQSMVVFAKKALGTGLRETVTETAQTVVGQGLSATGLEGLTGEELVSAAGVGGMSGFLMGAGPAGIDAGAFNRQMKADQNTLEAHNLNLMEESAKDFGIQVNDYETQFADLVSKYEGPELDTKIEGLKTPTIKEPELFDFDRVEPSTLSKLTRQAADATVFKSTEFLRNVRPKLKSSHNFFDLNRVLRSFSDTETGSGEYQTSPSFNTLKFKNVSEYVEPFMDIRDKWAGHYFMMGEIGSKIPLNIDKYIGQSLEDKIDSTLQEAVRKELGVKKMVELEADIVKLRNLQNKVFSALESRLGRDGLKIGFTKDYLTRGIDKAAVKANPKDFLKALEETYINAEGKEVKGVNIEPTKDKVTGEIIETADQVRQGILNDILNDVDPSTLTSEQIRKVRARKGVNRPSFEKTRDGRWSRLPEEFRKKSPMESIGDYLSGASIRLASSEAFGADNANRLNQSINNLLKDGVISNPQAQRIWDLYDAVHHVYKRPQDDAARTRQSAFKTIQSVAAIKYLGMATISSITEPVWIGQRSGYINMIKSAPTMAAHLLSGLRRSIYGGSVGKEAHSSFARDLNRLMGFAINPAYNERIAQFFVGDNNQTMQLYFRLPAGAFLTQYTNFVGSWAAVTSLKFIEGQAKKLHRIKGNAKKRLENELKENGMTIQDFEAMYRAGGNKIDILNDTWLDTMITKSDGTRTRVRDLIVPWLRKMVTDVRLEPTAANRPLWMSNPDMQLLAQLKSFPILFGNTIARRVLRKLNPKSCTPALMQQMSTLAAIGAALGMAALALAIKDEIRGSERERGLVDLVGAIGVPIVGEESVTGYVGGPAAGMADNFLQHLYGNGLAETLAETPEQFFDILLRATLGAIGAETLGGD